MAEQTAPAPNQGATGDAPVSDNTYDDSAGDPFSERPELFVGAAFAGGLALAILLRRLGP